MRHSSKVSACRRELNSHKAAKPRAASHSHRRANPRAWVECRPETEAMVPCPFTSLVCRTRATRSTTTASGRQRSSPGAAKVCIGGVSQQKLPMRSLPPHCPQRAAASFRCSSSGVEVHPRARSLCASSAALPNPSFKPSPNGVPRGPGRRYAVHFRQPGPRVTPLVPA